MVFSPKVALGEDDSNVFRLHLMGETYTLDPTKLRGSGGSYLFHNIQRGLFSYDRERGLVNEGAKSCRWPSPMVLECELNELLWSDGSPILAEDYLRTFRRVIDPENGGAHAEMLLSLRNAKQIFAGELSVDSLGVLKFQTGKVTTLKFFFETQDVDFLYKLSHPYMAPTPKELYPKREKAHKLKTSGPFKIKKWRRGKSVKLTNNEFYLTNQKPRPDVNFLFIDDDATALSLYEAGKLSFLRRLPTQYIPKFRGREDFFQLPVARFDMIGFGPDLKDKPQLRKALTMALNYRELQTLLFAKGKPGCPSLPRDSMAVQQCYYLKTMDLPKIKRKMEEHKDLSFGYSKMGGEDIKRQVEWFQNQWKKRLGLELNLRPFEQGMYINALKSEKTPSLFRKGMSLDVPTCLSAMMSLTPGHPENYIRYNSEVFNKKVAELQKATHPDLRKQLCSQALKILLDDHVFIPLGEIHFTLLANTNWQGWRLNELNQLDLSEISKKTKQP
jgi:oligopeptide transport system substrate-binding protein